LLPILHRMWRRPFARTLVQDRGMESRSTDMADADRARGKLVTLYNAALA